MITRNVLVRTIMSAIAFVLLALCIASCATGETTVDKVIREMTLCKKAGRSAARPTNDPKLSGIVRTVADERTPSGGILLCTIPNQPFPIAESATFPDEKGRPTLVIWHEDRLFKELDSTTVRFVIAHEFGHRIVGVVCSENERRYYLYCEHMIDRVAAKIVGANDAVHGLEQLMGLMVIRGATPPNTSLVKARIDLLKAHASD